MLQRFVVIFGAVLVSQWAMAQTKGPITPQAERGKQLFTSSTKGTPCGTCHKMGDTGNAVGPDLKTMASYVSPQGIVSTMHMSMTAYTQEVKTSDGKHFPAFEKGKQGDQVELWDLSENPPVLRTYKAKDVSTKQNEKWKHPPSTTDYSAQELADIVAFLKWAATGVQKDVSPEEVQ
jgi:mono/diheme cytochrome c family protein